MFEEVIQANPDNWHAHEYLARMFLSSGERQRAHQHLLKMEQIDSHSVEGNYLMALYCYQNEEFERAVAYGERARSVQPGYADVRDLLGNIYFGLAQPEKALEEYRAAVRLAPARSEAAINQNTVAVHWAYMTAPGAVSLEQTVAVAHRYDKPVIVDAAAALPPAENLRRFVVAGADLICFSGGKAIRGPQASGILLGRRDLIDSVALQHQDMDVLPETWTLRRKYLESGMLPGPPLQGIGRALKVGKEEIAGLLTALKIYVNKDHAAESREWIRRLAVLQQSLENIPNLRAELSGSENEGFPLLQISTNEKALGITAFDLINQLLDGDPAIAVGQ